LTTSWRRSRSEGWRDVDFRAKHLAILHFDCEHTSTRLCQLSGVCYYRTCCCRLARLVHRWNAPFEEKALERELTKMSVREVLLHEVLPRLADSWRQKRAKWVGPGG
jgi:hypothetical protein